MAGLRIATVGVARLVKLIGTAVVPPGPVAVTVRLFTPVGRVASGPHEYEPVAVAVVLQSVPPFGAVITIRLPGVAVPAIVGVVVVDTFTGEVTVRLGGAATVKVLNTGDDVPPGLPAVAVTVLTPAVKVVGIVAVKPPVGLARAVTLLPLLAVSVTVLPGVAVPLTAFTPAGCVVLLAGVLITTDGTEAPVSVTGWLVVPPGVEAVTVTCVTPAVIVTGHENVPDAEAVVVQSVRGPGPVITT